MKTSIRLAVALLLVLFAGVATATDCPAPVNQATGLPGVAPGLETPAQPPAADLAPVEGPDVSEKACTASALCDNGTTITCSLSGSGTCQGVNASCPSEVGFVRCGGNYSYCPNTCPSCPGTLSCEDLNAGNYGPGVCPSRCVGSDGFCGYCFPGPGGCICTL